MIKKNYIYVYTAPKKRKEKHIYDCKGCTTWLDEIKQSACNREGNPPFPAMSLLHPEYNEPKERNIYIYSPECNTSYRREAKSIVR